MVAIALLSKRFPQVKVPRNDTPGFPNRQGFLGTPLLQAAPVKFMQLSELDLLLQPLVVPVLQFLGSSKSMAAFLDSACCFSWENTLNNFQNSSCLFWMSLLVVGPRVMFNLAHDDPPAQGPAKNNTSLVLALACLALKCNRNNLYVPALRKRSKPVVRFGTRHDNRRLN